MLPRELAPRFALSQADLFYESDPWTRELFAMGEMVQGRLEAEIARVAAHRDKAAAHRSAADALFTKGGG